MKNRKEDPGPICKQTRDLLSAFLEGDVSGAQMYQVAQHLGGCSGCSAEMLQLRNTQALLASMGPVKAPADLPLRLRVAISQERQRMHGPWLRQRLQARWDNVFAPFLMKAGAGLASAVALLGIVGLSMVATPVTVSANDDPIQTRTSPHLRYVSAGADVGEAGVLDSVVIQAFVNTSGRVYDYRIVSGPNSPEVRDAVTNRLLLSVFEPARIFGQPVSGQAVLSFSGLNIRG